MLTDSQILHLLARCEAATGRLLPEIRGKLQSDDKWISTLWELVVADAAARIGLIGYEIPTPGGKRLDLFVEISGNKRLWIEAAFAFEQSHGAITSSSKHRVFRILQGKAEQARLAAVKEPIVVCIGTDRGFSVGPSHAPSEVGRDRAVYDFFGKSRSLSAAIIVPVLLRPEILVGFARDARPAFFKNSKARNSLPTEVEFYLQQLDFNRWSFSLWTEAEPPKVRQSLCDAIRRIGDSPIDTSSLDCHGVPSTLSSFPSPTWAYCWHFHHLRIAKLGDRYWLFDGDRAEASSPSAEEAAKTASDLFQPYPAHVFTPNGVQLDPDRGVPADLREWNLEM